jgi:hypothetical protein
LGGIFVVSYEDSPIGPYREVAVLSGLVLATPAMSRPWTWSLGAWASHILVDSQAAMTYGQEFWGLPTQVVEMEFEKGNNMGGGTTLTFLQGSNENAAVRMEGWTAAAGSTDRHDKPPSFAWWDVSLPSLSGCLPISGKSDTRSPAMSPLLEYPLRITHPRSIRVLLPRRDSIMTTEYLHHTNNNSTDPWYGDIQQLLAESKPSISLLIDDVELEAGMAREVS